VTGAARSLFPCTYPNDQKNTLEVTQTCHTETKASCSVHNEKLKMQGRIYPAFPLNNQGASNFPENTVIDRENLKPWIKDY
jgi:hypothetical protein